MVSNNSTLGQDASEVASGIASGARAVGQTLGLVAEEVIPGDPQEVTEAGEHLRKLSSACERVGSGIKRLDTGDWTGEAAENFHANYLQVAAPQWTTAADAFGEMGQALVQYAQVLAEQQRTATQAQGELKQAKEQAKTAAEAHNAQIDAGNPPAQPFQDPTAQTRAQAQHTIDRAKETVAAAGDRAAASMRSAAARAPAQPGVMAQLAEQASDALATNANAVAGIATGVGTAVAGLGGLVLGGLKAEAYFGFGGALIDPQGGHDMITSAASTASAAFSYSGLKTMVGVDTWKNHPTQALGEAVPNALAYATGGGGAIATASKVAKATKAARTGERVAETGADAGKTAERAATAPESAPQFSPASPWQRGELPSEKPQVRLLDEPESPPTRAVPDRYTPLRPSDPADQWPTARGESGFDDGPTAREAVGPHSRPESHSGPDPSGHEPDRSPHTAPERDTELPREERPDESDHHERGPADEEPHDGPHHDSPDAPERGDPDAPDHHAHDLDPAVDEPPRYEGRPLRDRYHGEQHGGVFDTPVRYLDDVERQDYRLHVDDDGLLRDNDGDVFDTSHADSLFHPQGGRAIFVMDQHGDIFASKHQTEGHFHHSSFLGGEPVGAAGELGVKDGKVQLISNNSGHYHPTKTDTYDFIKNLYNDKGAFFDRENLDVKFADGSTY